MSSRVGYGGELVHVPVAETWSSHAGEPWWIQRMIEEHHDEAVAKGVKIVHCCGFDSVPSDLGTQAMVEHIRRTHDRRAVCTVPIGNSASALTPLRGALLSLAGHHCKAAMALITGPVQELEFVWSADQLEIE